MHSYRSLYGSRDLFTVTRPLLTSHGACHATSFGDAWLTLNARGCGGSFHVCIICGGTEKCLKHLKFCAMYPVPSGRGISRIRIILKFVLTVFVSRFHCMLYVAARSSTGVIYAISTCHSSLVAYSLQSSLSQKPAATLYSHCGYSHEPRY